jgi:hypothetical protein
VYTLYVGEATSTIYADGSHTATATYDMLGRQTAFSDPDLGSCSSLYFLEAFLYPELRSQREPDAIDRSARGERDDLPGGGMVRQRCQRWIVLAGDLAAVRASGLQIQLPRGLHQLQVPLPRLALQQRWRISQRPGAAQQRSLPADDQGRRGRGGHRQAGSEDAASQPFDAAARRAADPVHMPVATERPAGADAGAWHERHGVIVGE